MKRILFLLVSTLLLLPSTLAGEHILGGSLTEWNAFLEKVSENPLLLQNPAGVQLELTREDIEAYIEAKEVQGFLEHDLFIPSTEGITYLKLSIADTITQSVQTTKEEQSLTYPASDVRITPGNDLFTIEGDNAKGYALEEPYLLSSLEAFLIEAYHGNAQILEIPMQQLEPEVLLIDGESETRLDIVAEGVSDFSGSTESRIHNIGVALARFNGYTIPKGETFSFNTQLGEVQDTKKSS